MSKKENKIETKLPAGKYFQFKKIDGIEATLTSLMVKDDGSFEVLNTRADLPRILIAKLLQEISEGYNS